MTTFSPTEIVTFSFYAWELRGRGWDVAPYPVALEPPFRPFRILPELLAERTIIDDGKRPTLMSSFVDSVRDAFRPNKALALVPSTTETIDEPLPYPAYDEVPLLALHLEFSEDHETKPKVMLSLLSALGTTLHPVAVEIVGADGVVRMQIVCAESDRDHIESQVISFAPEIGMVEADNLVWERWDEGCIQHLVDFGLSQEFFLPLCPRDALPIDPYVTLIPTLARARDNEFVAVQVLFEGVRNSWKTAIRRAVDDGHGGSIFSDAPEFPRLAQEKIKTSLFAVSLRVAAQAEESDRAWELVRGTGVFFRQFAHPGGNELLPLENRGYPDSDHAEAFRTYRSFRSGMILSAEELGAIAHFPDASVRHPAFLRASRRTKTLPAQAKGHALILGQNIHRGLKESASLSTEARLQHTWIVGASGSGKSHLLLQLILQDIAQGEGIAVLDPHGDLIDDILAKIPERRQRDIVIFDPSDTEWPVGFNILSAESEVEKTLLTSDLVGVFRRLSTSWGDTMSTVLGNAVLAVLESSRGGTLLDLRQFLVDERFRRSFLETVEDPATRFFWAKEYPLIGSRAIGPILTRLDTFLRPRLIRNIVGQQDGKLDLEAVMREQKVLLVRLPLGLIGEENASLLGSLLLGKFQELALARQSLAKDARVPFFLYADEFQNFITPSLETLLSGARKYGVGLTLAHQTLAQLSSHPKVESALLGNAFTRIIFRVGEHDARKLAEGFSSFGSQDLATLGRGEAVVRLGSSSNDFNLLTPPAPRFEGDEAERVRETVIASSREKYALPLRTVKAAFEKLHGMSEGEDTPGTIEKTLPPPIPLIDQEGAKKKATCKPPGKASPRERELDAAPPLSGRGGPEHKYLQHLVKRLAEERGFRASIEGETGVGRADVVLRKESISIGVEISITTDVEHETENMRKCLGAEFTHVLFISPNARRRKEISKRFAGSTPSVLVCGPEEIVTMLDSLNPESVTAEATVRGYKIKVTRQVMTPEETAGRRSAVASVIAKSLGKRKQGKR